MQAAQELFDRDVAPACPSELAAPRLHAARDDLVAGARGAAKASAHKVTGPRNSCAAMRTRKRNWCSSYPHAPTSCLPLDAAPWLKKFSH
jgi:hypothetical protein